MNTLTQALAILAIAAVSMTTAPAMALPGANGVQVNGLSRNGMMNGWWNGYSNGYNNGIGNGQNASDNHALRVIAIELPR